MEESFEKLGEVMCRDREAMPVRRDLLKLHEFADGTGRGLCAKEDIPRGQVLLQIPLEYTIRADLAREVIGSHVFPSDMSDDDIIAVYLMWARCNRDKISELHRIHLDLLPAVEQGPSALHQTMFWTEEELEELKGSEAYETALVLKQQVRQDFGDIVNRVFLPNQDLFPLTSSNFTYREYKWALAIIWSRGMDFLGATQGGKGSIHCIVPWADMFNTKPSVRQCHFYSQKNNCIGVIATEAIKKGEQAFINYGKVTNARMLRLYGFILPNNPDNKVPIWVTLDPSSPKYDETMEKIRKVVPNGFDPNQSPFLLSLDEPLPNSLLETVKIHHQATVPLPDPNGNTHLIALEAALVAMLNRYPGSSDQEAEGDAINQLTLATRELNLLEGGNAEDAALARLARKKLALELRIAECSILNASLASLKELLGNIKIASKCSQPSNVDDDVQQLDCMD